MQAFKGTNNGKCQNLQYEAGKTYELIGDLKICKQGFHFCKNIEDVHEYYSFNNKTTEI